MSDEQRAAGAPTEEERARAIREQLRSLHAFDLAYEMMISLVSFGYQKMGLTDETSELRDLGDARLAIELLRANLEAVQLAGGAPAPRPPAAEPPAAEPPADEGVAKEPAVAKAAPRRPAAKKPVAKRPAAKKTAAKKPVAEKPAAKKPRGGATPPALSLIHISEPTRRTPI